MFVTDGSKNSGHWPRDTQLGEDGHRYREPNGVEILATLRSLAMKALRFDGCWSITEGLAAMADDIRGLLARLACRAGNKAGIRSVSGCSVALGRPIPPLVLSEGEIQQLQSIASSQALPPSIQRAQIVLACVAGETNTSIAKRMGLTGMTVGKRRKRYRELGLVGLHDELIGLAPTRTTQSLR